MKQNWSDQESEEFYNLAQGSKLVPYDWFLALEQSGSQELFRNTEHMRGLGLLPRHPDGSNPDGLPVGLVKDPYPKGQPDLGLTCAACHTAQIRVEGTSYLVDGAPSLVDLEAFLRGLEQALEATLNREAKFERFATRVGGDKLSARHKARLKTELGAVLAERQGYNQRNLSKRTAAAFGHGRVDAFGAIMNEVTVRFLDVPDNAREATAPVSFPALWGTPQHDRVQWNGVAKNTNLPISVAGTTHIGALGRNMGEVFGVFGSTDPSNEKDLTYPNSIKRDNLIRLEELVRTLWSPLIPMELDEGLKSRGAEVYGAAQCAQCHGDPSRFRREDVKRKIRAVLVDVGTDPTMFLNVVSRTAKTGVIQGRAKGINPFKKFGDKAPFSDIVAHLVARSLFGRQENQSFKSQSEFDPYEATFSHVVSGFDVEGVGTLVGDFEDVTLDPATGRYSFLSRSEVTLLGSNDSKGLHPFATHLPIVGFDTVRGDSLEDGTPTVLEGKRLRTEFELEAKAASPDRGVYRMALPTGPAEQLTFEDVGSPEKRLESVDWIRAVPTAEDGVTTRRFEVDKASPRVAYKARPLNGIWATAPYLHNGSVPNLAQLLTAPASRAKSFHVGSTDFDPKNVGLVSDAGPFVFDTVQLGNSNAGHDYGTDLSKEDKEALLVYLMSL